MPLRSGTRAAGDDEILNFTNNAKAYALDLGGGGNGPLAPGVDEAGSGFDGNQSSGGPGPGLGPTAPGKKPKKPETDKYGNPKANEDYLPETEQTGQTGSGQGPQDGHKNVMNIHGKQLKQWHTNDDGERVQRNATEDDNPYAGKLKNFDTAATGSGGKRGVGKTSKYDIKHLMEQGHSAKKIEKKLGNTVTGEAAQKFLEKKLGKSSGGNGDNGGNGNNEDAEDDNNGAGGNDNTGGTDTNKGGTDTNSSGYTSKYGALDAEDAKYEKKLEGEREDKFMRLNSAIGTRQQYYADRSSLAELQWMGDWRRQNVKKWKSPGPNDPVEGADIGKYHEEALDNIASYEKKYS